MKEVSFSKTRGNIQVVRQSNALFYGTCVVIFLIALCFSYEGLRRWESVLITAKAGPIVANYVQTQRHVLLLAVTGIVLHYLFKWRSKSKARMMERFQHLNLEPLKTQDQLSSAHGLLQRYEWLNYGCALILGALSAEIVTFIQMMWR